MFILSTTDVIRFPKFNNLSKLFTVICEAIHV